MSFIGFNNTDSNIIQPIFTLNYSSETEYTASYPDNLDTLWKRFINFWVFQFNPYRSINNQDSNNNTKMPCNMSYNIPNLLHKTATKCYRTFQNNWLTSYVSDLKVSLNNIIYSMDDIWDKNYGHRILANISLIATEQILDTDLHSILTKYQNQMKEDYTDHKLYKNEVTQIFNEPSKLYWNISEINQHISNLSKKNFCGVNISICKNNPQQCNMKVMPDIYLLDQQSIQNGRVHSFTEIPRLLQRTQTGSQKKQAHRNKPNLRHAQIANRMLTQDNKKCESCEEPVYNYTTSSYKKVIFGQNLQITYQNQGYKIDNQTGHYLHNIGSIILEFLDYKKKIDLFNQVIDTSFIWNYSKKTSDFYKAMIPLKFPIQLAGRFHLEADLNISIQLSMINTANQNSTGIFLLQTRQYIGINVEIEGTLKVIAEIFSTKVQMQLDGTLVNFTREIDVTTKHLFGVRTSQILTNLRQTFCCVKYKKQGHSKIRGYNEEYKNNNIYYTSDRFSNTRFLLQNKLSKKQEIGLGEQ